MIRERIATALREGDRQEIRRALDDWLSGLDLDEELSAEIERENTASRAGAERVSVCQIAK